MKATKAVRFCGAVYYSTQCDYYFLVCGLNPKL